MIAKKIALYGLVVMSALGYGNISSAESKLPTSYHVKNVQIGQLPVKTIVPITGPSYADALHQAEQYAQTDAIDLIELRLDLLDFYQDSSKLLAYTQQINQRLRTKPIIATIRTHHEGGKFIGTDQAYAKLYQQLIKQKSIQIIDVEMFRDQNIVKQLVHDAHQAGILVVMSNHDFQKTPDQQEITKRLLQQDALGADILKIAVMPQSKADVLTLMNATFVVSQQSSKPLLTMSMGQLGTITRVATASIGGSLSFGMLGQASAPGQIEVSKLKDILNTLQPTP
ncbi:type I 3-dehydroquinate dehydratase [Acinetobacter qingfengensis]|uniref:3-dehydroquinate dehydratase n=1 Tax=Acinetobacter qingfengensis TaxID=1262585 RepID=A0A1E7RD84_9GAMM|nr:type I 3-dehydroquinate dehydratase [Acinetobacter qingfengensis]KAA8734456.1 type I 3-dehydroquinate dehydratase [Acinetobacter qingfengensis]OEY97369.1 3-dehydroquinate dehydratase [Acinetobacter qingfengensis]